MYRGQGRAAAVPYWSYSIDVFARMRTCPFIREKRQVRNPVGEVARRAIKVCIGDKLQNVSLKSRDLFTISDMKSTNPSRPTRINKIVSAGFSQHPVQIFLSRYECKCDRSTLESIIFYPARIEQTFKLLRSPETVKTFEGSYVRH